VKKSKLLTILKSLSAVPLALSGSVLFGQDTSNEKAGIAGAIQPSVEGISPGSDSRVLFVGSDIFRNEVIKTGDEGAAHLMFADKSSLTIGPNSEVTIDKFVYNPETGSGALVLSASAGVLRFVGGALSKSGDVTVTTPSGTLGIRGGVMIVQISSAEGTFAFFLYGDDLTGTSDIGEARHLITQAEHWVRISPDGVIHDEGEMDLEQLEEIMGNFEGPDVEVDVEVESFVGLEAVPENYEAWVDESEEIEEVEQEHVAVETEVVEIAS
jgi:hypothetical protein